MITFGLLIYAILTYLFIMSHQHKVINDPSTQWQASEIVEEDKEYKKEIQESFKRI